MKSGISVWRAIRTACLAACVLGLASQPLEAQRSGPGQGDGKSEADAPGKLPNVSSKTRGMERREGFLNVFLDPDQGKVWLEVPPPQGEDGLAAELIYMEGLTTGLGSNPVGLDRGQVGESVFLRLRRVGSRVFLEAPNMRFRALSDNAAEARATQESFATSILWAQDISALDKRGTSLVDFTSFLVRDAHGVSKALQEAQQGSFRLDATRSVVDYPNCLAFPDNVELQVILTYAAGGEPGEHVQETAPLPRQITLVQHYSLVRPPEPGYRLRPFDPRISAYGNRVMDYAAGLDEPVEKRYLSRHRLHKTYPEMERSTAEEPLIYYVDHGAPEPVRSALVEGASWWAEAFEAAGFENAFRVEILPEDVHPLDARYNVIQWVHRSTRGWSYGSTLIDPRTGEIIKGHVNLGSLRVRQDRLIFEGLSGIEKTGSGDPDDPIQIALARIRQLSAHEVGHTLGFAHNFAASTYDGRASVMDYPAPWVQLEDGELDFSKAYGVGLGSWDVHAVRYAYTDFGPDVDEAAALDALVREGIVHGHVFISDEDARPEGASEPRGNLWDNGSDAVEGLHEALAVRRHALQRFGIDNLKEGRPTALLQEVLAPIYFYHRYQLDAAVKTLGGMEFNYTLVGDGQWATRQVSAERQRQALAAVLTVLEPQNLDLPEDVLNLLAPRPFDYLPNRELFLGTTSPAFDAMGAARSVADQAVRGLLQPERLARLADFRRRDPSMPSMDEVLQAITQQVFQKDASPRHAALRRATQWVFVERLMLLAESWVTPEVRSVAEWHLRRLQEDLQSVDEAHAQSLGGAIGRFRDRGMIFYAPVNKVADELPPGSPIGASRAVTPEVWQRPLEGASASQGKLYRACQGGL